MTPALVAAKLLQAARSLAALHAQGRVLGRVPLDLPDAADPAVYAAPEAGRGADARSDLYSLGAAAWHLLAGRPPFAAADPLELHHARLTRMPGPLPGVPEALAAIVERLLAKDPRDRYQTAESLLADLSRLGQGTRPFTIPGKLYGRERERAALLGAFERARAGEVAVVLLEGPPGAGKSRLAAELQEWGGAFASARFDAHARGGPRTLGEALRGPLRRMLGEPAPPPRELLQRSAALAGWIPELRHFVEKAPELLRPEAPLAALLGLLAERAQPLALFLDDVQWADRDSLELLARVAASPGLRGLLLACACRDGEPGARAPAEVAATLERQGLAVERVRLSMLDTAAVAALLEDACGAPAPELAQLIARKTGGNPLFVRALLTHLQREGLLRFSVEGFSWDLPAISALAVSDNVVELLLGHLHALPAQTRELLRVAGLLGRRFRAETLAAASGQPLDPLAPALEAHLLVREPDGFFAFAHDRFREAASALTPLAEQPALHCAMGRRLLAAQPDEAVVHLSRALELLEPPERGQFAALALAAGRRAAESAAFESAWSFFESGLAALGADGEYETWRALCAGAAEAAFAAGQPDSMERRCAELRARARTVAHELPAWLTLIKARMRDSRLQEALQLSNELLERSGRSYPRKGGKGRVLVAFLRTALAIGGRTPEELLALPPAADPLARGLQEICTIVAPAMLACAPELIPLGMLRDVRAVLREGVTAAGAQCWTGYAMLLITVFGKIELGTRYGDLALLQAERLGGHEVWPRVARLVYGTVRPWSTPLHALVQPLRLAGARGLEVGDFNSGLTSLLFADNYAYFSGQDLRLLEPELQRTARLIARHRDAWIEPMHALLRAHVKSLLSPEGGLVEPPPAPADSAVAFALAVGDLHQALLFGDYARALARACEPMAQLGAAPRSGGHLVYWTCAGVALWEAQARGLARDVSRRAAQARRELVPWTRNVPGRRYRLHWVDAAERRARGRPQQALELYDLALDGAHAAGESHSAGLIAEHAALAAEALGRWRLRDTYRKEALAAWRRWGAVAKVAQLRGPRQLADVDLLSVLKSSQALAEEVNPEALLGKVMSTLMESAGASRVALLLGGPDDARLVADVRPGPGPAELPLPLVLYVLRTGEPVVLADAAREGAWQREPYLQSARPRSVLCVPVLRGGAVRGAVYLENQLLPGCFTEDRLETVRLLASQAAISLENAALVEGLEAKVRERTAELAVARERAEVASRAKSDFLAHMSHELRTPLNAILGYAQVLLRRDDLDAGQREAAGTIRRSGTHLLGLIDDLLDLAKIEAGTLDLQLGDVHLPTLAEAVRELLAVQAAGKGLELTVEIAPEAVRRVRADERRLRQVLLNLLGNAVKFSERGEVRLALTAQADRVRFEVRDQGPGIDPAGLAKLFQPFGQAGDATSRARGVGLGLAISRQLVERMGGALSVESAVGQGSRFFAELPLPALPGASPAPSAPREAAVSGYRGPRHRILIIDDDAPSRLLLRDLLQPLGFEIELAEDGARGLALARAQPPSLVLTDLAMPGLDGVAVAEALQGTAPIVAVTSSPGARGDPGVFAERLAKPVDLDGLLGCLGRRLGVEWLREPPPASLPEAELAALRDASALGHMRAVAERARQLARTPALRPLAQRIEQLAVDFDDAGILELLDTVRAERR